jgi:hypothetical protein
MSIPAHKQPYLLRLLKGCFYALGYGLKLVLAYVRTIASTVAARDKLVEVSAENLLTASDFSPLNEPGFGDRWNSFPWSMVWWRDQLYVGTNRAFLCVEYFALHSALPFMQRYPPRFDSEARCPDSPLDLPLQAEIWRYTPATGRWTRVYQSPEDVSIPLQPGKQIARDIGFRDMAVFRDPDGTEALYVSGVSARPVCPSAPPPRILRSLDGETFEPVPQLPGTTLGDVTAVGFRSIRRYFNRFYITAGSLYGDGVLLEADHPALGSDFRQVLDVRIFEMVPFNGFLYLGLHDSWNGYAVVKMDATGKPPYRLEPIVSRGAFLKRLPSTSVLSMCVFQDALYVGTDAPAELIRIFPDDSWELVMGSPRKTPQGWKHPISGFGEGFGYPLNREIGRMQEHNGWLYVATANFAGKFLTMPFANRRIRDRLGFSLYATRDGKEFREVTGNGLSHSTAFAARTFASTPHGLFLGASDVVSGAVVFLGNSRREHPDRQD